MIYKLKYIGDKVVVASLPLSSWTIVNTNTLSVSSNTVTQLGVGGWYESMYKSFTVPTTGSYTISYDYDIASGVVGGHGTYGFGLWLTTNNPNVSGDPQYQFYANSANRNGPAIANASTNMAGMKGNITFTATLTANTTYYLWYPGAALDDGTTYTLTFRNIAVYNNPIQYTMDKDIKFNGTRVTYDYTEPPPPSYNVIYENSNTYTTGEGLFVTGQLSSSKNIIAMTFNLSTSTSNVDSYVFIRTNTDTSKNIWCGNARNYGGYDKASYFRSSASGWNALMNPSVGSDGAVTGNVYYAPSISASATNSFKIIFDRSASKAYCYINKNNILNADYITFNPLNFESGIGGSSVSYGNMKVYECDDMAAALSI